MKLFFVGDFLMKKTTFVFLNPNPHTLPNRGERHSHVRNKDRIDDIYLTNDEFIRFLLMLPKCTKCTGPNHSGNKITSSFTFAEQNQYSCQVAVNLQQDKNHKIEITIVRPNVFKFIDDGPLENTKDHIWELLPLEFTDQEINEIIYNGRIPKFELSHPFRKLLKHINNKSLFPECISNFINLACHDPRYNPNKKKEKITLNSITKEYNGIFHISTTDEKNNKYCLKYNDLNVHSMVWFSDIFPSLLNDVSINCIELDTSFDAVYPYVYSIINFIIFNESLPVGFSLGPTEKAEIYSKPYKIIQNSIAFSHLFEKLKSIPILSDEGKALEAFSNQFGLVHYLCFHHLIKKFGANSRIGGIVKKLLFSSYSAEMFQNKFNEYRIAICETLQKSDNETIKKFDELFNSKYDKKSNSFIKEPHFDSQSLFSRKQFGIPTTTNHSESSHQKLNALAEELKDPAEKLLCLMQYIIKREDEFPTFRNFNESIKKQQKIAAALSSRTRCGEYCRERCSYFANLYGLDEYPCIHQNFEEWNKKPIYPAIKHDENVHYIMIEKYSGDWCFKDDPSNRLPRVPFCSEEDLTLFEQFCGDPDINFEDFYQRAILEYRGVSKEKIISLLPNYYKKFCCSVYGFYNENAQTDFMNYFEQSAKHNAILTELIEKNKEERDRRFAMYRSSEETPPNSDVVDYVIQLPKGEVTQNVFDGRHFIRFSMDKIAAHLVKHVPTNPITEVIDPKILETIAEDTNQNGMLNVIESIKENENFNQHVLYSLSLRVSLFKSISKDFLENLPEKSKRILTIAFFTALKLSPNIHNYLSQIKNFFEELTKFPQEENEKVYLCLCNLLASICPSCLKYINIHDMKNLRDFFHKNAEYFKKFDGIDDRIVAIAYFLPFGVYKV